MKKTENPKATKNEAQVEMKPVEKPERVKKPQTNEMKKLNEMSKKLRLTAWRFVRRIQGSQHSDEMMKRLEEGYGKVIELILSMTNETMLSLRFSNLNEAERAYLKKMLDNYNA